MKRTFAAVAGWAAAVLIVGCRGGEPTPLEIGATAPAFSLPAVGEAARQVNSDEFSGQITVLNFWSTNCSVCLRETEELARVQDGGKAVVIGIALDEDADHVGQFVKHRGIKYPVLKGNEDVFSLFDGYSIPYTLVLDRSRSVRKKVYGRVGADELSAIIDEIDRSPVALGSAKPGGGGRGFAAR